MDAFLLFVAKSSGIIIIFYAVYELSLKKETFFKFNRYFLLTGIACAVTLPFVTIIEYVQFEPVALNVLESTGIPDTQSGALTASRIDWAGVLFTVYFVGMSFLLAKFIMQMVSLFKIIGNHTVTRFGGYNYVESDLDIAPFSFFNYIFYNPSQFGEGELSAIIKHEVVHSSQGHSIDVILAHLMTIATWINPISWLYRSCIKQNLEFLADEGAVQKIPSPKGYQYALLKVSGNQFCKPIVNTFYNSLVKKRIVMLNKSKSNKTNILKTTLVLPALGIFLISFNTKEVLIPIGTESDSTWVYEAPTEIIEVLIDKNTTDKELKKIKKDLAKKGVSFSYTAVHNEKNEITSISIDFIAKNNGSETKSSSSFNNDDKPIDPILIVYNADSNSISIGNAKSEHINVHEDDDHTIWMHSDDDGANHKTIEIIEKNGKETIKVDGKEVSREDYEAMKEKDGIHEKHIRIKKSVGKGDNNVFIMKDSGTGGKTVEIIEENGKETIRVNGKEVSREEYEAMQEKDGTHEKHVIIRKSKSDGQNDVFIWKDSDHEDEDIIKVDGGKGFFFIDTDGDENPLFIIDGKESTRSEVEKMDPSEIEKIEVIKGDKAEEKYGTNAKNGVVEITSKKKKN